MQIYTRKAELQAHLTGLRSQGKTVGFVPTMGALHRGHLSLIEQAKQNCDVSICSVFVNPTQFNDKKDLENYPRTPEKDTQILQNSPCDLLFMPSVDEMYKKDEKANFDFGYLDKILEGAHRPGHFNGVAQVVKRFFEIIQPDLAFFGSKDYQQVMIVKALVGQMHSNIKVVECPIVREADGLAMSSRNALLGTDERKTASHIPSIMKDARQIALQHSVGAAKLHVIEKFSQMPGTRLDYYEICDANSLRPLDHLDGNDAVSLIAAYVGKVRLIDNLPIA